jgi:general secretion pathway protein G
MDERNQQPLRRSALRRVWRLLRRDRLARRAAAAQRGMTLIEIMVVIAIIGLLMGAVAFLVIPRFTKAKEGTAKILVEKVYNAAAEYYTIAPPGGGCPTTEDLVREDLIKEEQTKDQWGNPLEIECAGDVVERVTSAGKDGQMGNDDDISYSESKGER